MRRLRLELAAAALAALMSAGIAAAQTPMKATAPDKMMPAGDAAKMRECDRLSMQPGIKLEDRAAFVQKCMAENKAAPK